MNRLAVITLATLATVTTLAGTANAQDRRYYGYHGGGMSHDFGYGQSGARGDRIDARQFWQHLRIYGAAASGELTWHEGARLMREQDRIGRMERDARRDGYITRDEAYEIRRAQDAASRHITRESTDWQVGW